MWPVSSAWLDALGRPHGMYARAEAWYDGAFVADVPVSGGQVQVTARQRVRRTLTLLVPETMWPDLPTDPLAVEGGRVKVWIGITDARGQLIGDEMPVFGGRVEEDDGERFSGHLTVTGVDPGADLADAQFEQPHPASGGTPTVSNISGLITEAVPDAAIVDLTGSQAYIPAFIMFDQDRGQAIDDLAASIGAEVICLPDGVTWHVRPVPSLADAPVWTVKEGQGGVLVRDVKRRSRTDVPNRLIVHAEQAGSSPIVQIVTDDDPNSATRYGGPYGRVVRHTSNSLISTSGQALAAGRAKLARLQGINRSRQLDIVPNPALEAGDVIWVATAEGTELHIADTFAVPLAPTDVMSITTRTTLLS